MVLTEATITAIDSDQAIEILPEEYMLMQNYPNPFNPETTIEYSVPEQTRVNISIYNILGHRVRTLVDNKKNQGFYNVIWDAKDDRGNPVSTGLYIYVLTTGDKRIVKKMALIR
jgi:hypothetical protein